MACRLAAMALRLSIGVRRPLCDFRSARCGGCEICGAWVRVGRREWDGGSAGVGAADVHAGGESSFWGGWGAGVDGRCRRSRA